MALAAGRTSRSEVGLDEYGWSVYGAERSQTVATFGKTARHEKRHDSLQSAAERCQPLRTTRDGKEGVISSSLIEGL
jgi:hypothetical protein